MSGIQSPDEAFNSNGATADRDDQGRFLSGRKGGPGRRKGSRVKLVEDVVSDVLDSWRQHGPIVLERLACLDPGKYADFIAKVLPREVKVEHTSNLDDVSDDLLAIMLEQAEARLAATKTIDGTVLKNVTPALPPPLADAPPTSAQIAAEAQRRDLHDQHDALRAAEPITPAATPLPRPVGRAVPVSARETERRNVAKLHDDDIDPASLF